MIDKIAVAALILFLVSACAGWLKAWEWKQNYYALAKVCDEKYGEVGRLRADQNRCRQAIIAAHQDNYEQPLLLDTDSEPEEFTWYGYRWEYKPETY